MLFDSKNKKNEIPLSSNNLQKHTWQQPLSSTLFIINNLSIVFYLSDFSEAMRILFIIFYCCWNTHVHT